MSTTDNWWWWLSSMLGCYNQKKLRSSPGMTTRTKCSQCTRVNRITFLVIVIKETELYSLCYSHGCNHQRQNCMVIYWTAQSCSQILACPGWRSSMNYCLLRWNASPTNVSWLCRHHVTLFWCSFLMPWVLRHVHDGYLR